VVSTRCIQPTLRIAGDAGGVTHGFCLIVTLSRLWHQRTAYLTEPHKRGFIRALNWREIRRPWLGIV
jgi:hypothetical protein